MEKWKNVIGYENSYLISSYGRIKSLDRLVVGKNNGKYFFKGKILKAGIDSDGYLHFGLSKNSKGKTLKAHRLVAIHFIENDNLKEKKQINHKDGNKKNNYYKNLEWCDGFHNIKHAYNNNLIKSKKGENHYRSKLTEKQVIEILEIYSKGTTYKQLSKIFNVSYGVIWKIINKINWKHI